MDDLDRALLALLQRDASQPYAALGQAVGLSPGAAHERVRKLRERGVIRRTTIEVDPVAVGRGVLAFVMVRAGAWMGDQDTRAALAALPEVQEAHVIAGPATLLLKIRTASTASLQDTLRRIFKIDGVGGTEAVVVLETFFERPADPVAETAPQRAASAGGAGAGWPDDGRPACPLIRPGPGLRAMRLAGQGGTGLGGDAPAGQGGTGLAGQAGADEGEPRLAYNGLSLDRAAAQRGDAAWVETVLGRPSTRLIPFWREKCLTSGRPGTGSQPAILAAPAAAAALAAAAQTVLLGLDGEAGVFAIDLSRLERADALGVAGATDAADVRAIFTALDAQQAATLGYALGILRWHRDQRFCGACGHPTASCHGGTQRRCTSAGCGKLLFPRIEPAVITLVEAPGAVSRCLLARHRGAAPGAFATLAASWRSARAWKTRSAGKSPRRPACSWARSATRHPRPGRSRPGS